MTDQPTSLDLDDIEARAAGLYEYATGLDDAWQAEADQLAGTDVPALIDTVRRLLGERDRYRGAWQSARERAQAYGEGILTVVKDREAYQGWLKQAEARIAELERPAVEAKRNEIRQSYAELVAAAEETKDYEGAFDVQCRLREREEQWAREDAAIPAP